jgi:hypothetical protein
VKYTYNGSLKIFASLKNLALDNSLYIMNSEEGLTKNAEYLETEDYYFNKLFEKTELTPMHRNKNSFGNRQNTPEAYMRLMN